MSIGTKILMKMILMTMSLMKAMSGSVCHGYLMWGGSSGCLPRCLNGY